MSHNYRIKVRGFHCDLYGHVNNARYLEFLEEARWDYVESAPELLKLGQRGLGFVVAAITIEYKQPVGVGEVVEIQSEMAGFPLKRAVMRQTVVNAASGKVVAAAEVTFALIDLKTGRALAMDGQLQGWFSAAGGVA